MATYRGTNDPDVWIGTDEDDSVVSLAGGDLLHGMGGVDSFQAGAGDDTIYGGDGDDRLLGQTENDFLYGEGGVDSIVGGAGHDYGDGGDGDDWVGGDSGDDELHGGRGRDQVRGGQNDDTLEGGADDDWLAGSPASDIFDFVAPWDAAMGLDAVEEFTPGDGDRIRLPAGVDLNRITLRDVGPGQHAIWSNPYGGLVLSYDGNPFALLVGFTAASYTTAWFDPVPAIRNTIAYTRSYVGSDAVESYVGTPGLDIILPGANDDIGWGGRSDDLFDGNYGNDTFYGGSGNDIMYGGVGDGRDALYGDEGDDLAFGGLGTDTIEGGAGNDLLFGGPQRDVMRGDGGNDWLLGEDGTDVLVGGHGDDVLDGGAGDDAVSGGAGNDTVIGGPGDDTLAGQAHADLFIVGEGVDALNDFSFSGGDRIAVSGVTDLAAFLARLTVQDGPKGLVLAHDGVVFATLRGHTAADFSATWFLPEPDLGPLPYPVDGPPDNIVPVLAATGLQPAAGQTVFASSLFTYFDADGDPAVNYEVWDQSAATGSGRFVITNTLNGANTVVKPNVISEFAPDRFANLRVEEGTASDNDLLFVRAYDGVGWSDWTLFG